MNFMLLMKILAYVDSHGSTTAYKKLKKLVKKEKPELIICAGDITIFSANFIYIVHQINRFHIPTLIIHGNHESELEMKKACSLFKYTKFVHRKLYEVDNYVFIGYGGGGFSIKDKEFEKFIKTKERKLKDKTLILITHGPPYGTKVDNIMGSYSGNKSYTKFIKQYQPKLVICGHLHENEGLQDKIGKSRIINPGPYGKIFNI